MGKELVPVEPAVEMMAEPQEEQAMDHDTFDDFVDVLPEGAAPVETSLDETEEAALELGIASVLGTIRAGSDGEEDGDGEGEDADATFALLDELNRLWARPLAA